MVENKNSVEIEQILESVKDYVLNKPECRAIQLQPHEITAVKVRVEVSPAVQPGAAPNNAVESPKADSYNATSTGGYVFLFSGDNSQIPKSDITGRNFAVSLRVAGQDMLFSYGLGIQALGCAKLDEGTEWKLDVVNVNANRNQQDGKEPIDFYAAVVEIKDKERAKHLFKEQPPRKTIFCSYEVSRVSTHGCNGGCEVICNHPDVVSNDALLEQKIGDFVKVNGNYCLNKCRKGEKLDAVVIPCVEKI